MLTYDPFKIAAAHEEFWNNHNLIPLKELLAPQATHRFVFEKEQRPYLVAVEETLKLYRTAFPDLHFTYANIIPSANTLALEWTVAGTHKGKFREFAPTGKFGIERGITIIKLNEDGKIVKETVYFDLMTMFRNLGLVPVALEEPKVRELTTAFIEAFNHHDIILLRNFFLPDHTAVLEDGRVLAAAEHLNMLVDRFVAFPDVKLELKELAIRLNESVAVLKVTGTNKAPLGNIPATNRKFEFETTVVINRLGDKIRQVNYYQDLFTFMLNLNLVPEPAIK